LKIVGLCSKIIGYSQKLFTFLPKQKGRKEGRKKVKKERKKERKN
jgi:hypothetical protein